MGNMEGVISFFMCSFLLWAILLFGLVLKVSGNVEVDALNALKNSMVDPNNVLSSWDPTPVNPCTWYHVTCNDDNSVTRVDLGNANLTGLLVPQLGQLSNLQYLELSSNNISGKIPDELGNLTNLVSLDLYLNRLTGRIPDTLSKLKKLRFLRLYNNSLSGGIPMSLTTVASLQVLDLSNNKLTGEVPVNGSFSLFSPISFNNNPGLIATSIPPPPISHNPGLIATSIPPPPISHMPPAPSGKSAIGAIAGGVAAGAALLFATPAIAFAYYRRRKPEDYFFDVPAEEDPEAHLAQLKKIPLCEMQAATANFSNKNILGRGGVDLGQLKKFPLLELQVATDNFSDKNILGRGAFGKVYKGRLADGSLVAVKRLKEERIQGGELQFQTEMIVQNHNPHLNGLYGSVLHWELLGGLLICMIIVIQRLFTEMSELQIYCWMTNLKQLLETLV